MAFGFIPFGLGLGVGFGLGAISTAPYRYPVYYPGFNPYPPPPYAFSYRYPRYF